ncbi:MAG: anion permease [Micrococcales bacterium]|nr:MAG: anion permease [Micrococcales bacterium]
MILFGVVVGVAVMFAVTNGLHDACAAVAGAVRTRALTPLVAVVSAASFTFLGALLGNPATASFPDEFIDTAAGRDGLALLLAALLGATAWNLITWRLGLPTSSTHALLGGLTGAVLAGGRSVDWAPLLTSLVLPLVGLTVVAGGVAALAMGALIWAAHRQPPATTNRRLRIAQSVTASAVALGHGMHDGQRVAAVLLLALALADAPVAGQTWVLIWAAVAIGAGTLVGGWRITRTVARRIVRIEPATGFVAESTTAGLLVLTSFGPGLPVSTSYTIVVALTGAGAVQNRRNVKWFTLRRIVLAWLATWPASAALAAVPAFVLVRP